MFKQLCIHAVSTVNKADLQSVMYCQKCHTCSMLYIKLYILIRTKKFSSRVLQDIMNTEWGHFEKIKLKTLTILS